MARPIKTDFVSGSFNDALDGEGDNDEIGAGSGNDYAERSAGKFRSLAAPDLTSWSAGPTGTGSHSEPQTSRPTAPPASRRPVTGSWASSRASTGSTLIDLNAAAIGGSLFLDDQDGIDSEIGEIMIGYHATETLLWIKLDDKPGAGLFRQLYNLPYDPAHLFNTRDIVF